MEKTIYDLELHEASTNIPWVEATRVPGGWIYRHWNDTAQDWYGSGIFVPWHNEFQQLDEKPIHVITTDQT